MTPGWGLRLNWTLRRRGVRCSDLGVHAPCGSQLQICWQSIQCGKDSIFWAYRGRLSQGESTPPLQQRREELPAQGSLQELHGHPVVPLCVHQQLLLPESLLLLQVHGLPAARGQARGHICSGCHGQTPEQRCSAPIRQSTAGTTDSPACDCTPRPIRGPAGKARWGLGAPERAGEDCGRDGRAHPGLNEAVR